MAAGSNTSTSYHCEEVPALSRHSISFNSSAMNSKWDTASMRNNQYGMSGLASMNMSMNSNSGVLSGTSSGSFGPDGTLGLNHDTGLAVEWSVDEQYTLERSFDKYKNEPNIIKYIWIAATLPDKTVRDVALRCQWMSKKRRKQEEHYSGKKVPNRKDKSVNSCPNSNLSVTQPYNMLTPSPLMQQFKMSGIKQSEASCDTIKHFLRQNVDAFNQISDNMFAFKFQENIELFWHAKNNLTAVLNEMRQLPGLPQLPISINEDLMNQLLPDVNQHMQSPMHWPMNTHLKQERRS